MNDLLKMIQPLTEGERIAARASAIETVKLRAGAAPNPEDFQRHHVSKYPPRITRLITILCIIVLAAAFAPSAIRLYDIGSSTFALHIPHVESKNLVGLASVLLAETGQVIFSLALAVMAKSRGQWWLLFLSAVLCTVYALVGNGQVAQPNSLFALLEAYAPPILVLSTSWILKSQMLDAIEQRHAATAAYQTALVKWEAATANPEQSPYFNQAYAAALRSAIHSKNKRRNAYKEVIDTLTDRDWSHLIRREIRLETWFETTPEDEQTAAPAPLESSNGKYHAALSGTMFDGRTLDENLN